MRAIVYDHSKAHPDDRYTHAHVLLTPFASSLHASKSSETHGPVPLYLKTFTNKDARWERRTFALDVSKLLAQKSCTLPMGQCGPDFSATDDGAVWVVSTPLQQEDRDDKAPCCSGEPTHQDDESMDDQTQLLYALQPVIFNPDTHESSIYSLGNQRGDTR